MRTGIWTLAPGKFSLRMARSFLLLRCQSNLANVRRLRELVKQKIQETEFQNAIRVLFFGGEIANNQKAQAALDKEWNNLLAKGVWDESKVKECRKIVNEARRTGSKVHLGRIFEACYEKAQNFQKVTLFRSKAGQCSKETMFVMKTAIMLCLANSDRALHPWKQQKCSMPSVASQAFQDSRRMPSRLTSRPSSLGCPHEFRIHQPHGPLDPRCHPDSGGIWEKCLNCKIAVKGWKQIHHFK